MDNNNKVTIDILAVYGIWSSKKQLQSVSKQAALIAPTLSKTLEDCNSVEDWADLVHNSAVNVDNDLEPRIR